MTTQDTTYNGWTNRETWAMGLWIDNEYGWRTDVDAMAGALLNDGWDSIPDWIETQTQAFGYLQYRLSDQIKEYMEAMFDIDEGLMEPRQIIALLHDIGSLYRVNYQEIAVHCMFAALERNDMLGNVLIEAINEYRLETAKS